MYNNLHRKKDGTVFLNVKPIIERHDMRKYSNNIMDSSFLSNGSDKKVRNSVGSILSQTHEFSSSTYYKNMAPANWFLRVLGALPISRSGPGKALFEIKSFPFMYSFSIFFFLVIYVFYVTKSRINIVRSLSGPFEEAVIAYLFLVNILPIFLIPIMWWETKKITDLMNDWDDFEVLFYQISGHSLPLNLRKKARTISTALPLVSLISVIITHVTMSDFDMVQVIPYCILDNLTAMLSAWWFLVCESLSNAANILGERFQQALRHIGPASTLADYRALWLRLSKLTRDTGNATCYTFTFFNLYLFFIITLSIYGLMSQLSEGFGIKDIGLTVTAVWNLSLLFFICDEAHYASLNVRTNFQKKLLMVELNWMNSDAQTEINMFLRATEMNPSNINCGGFFDINRNLFKALLTTMVTYLVVLLQFQISIPAEKDQSKSTLTTDMMMMNRTTDSGSFETEEDEVTTMMPTTTTTIAAAIATAVTKLAKSRKG